MIRFVPLALVVLALLGCGQEPRDVSPFGDGIVPVTGNLPLARGTMAELDAALAQAGTREGIERERYERSLQELVERTATACQGTFLENRAWYLLASWRFQFASLAEAETALDQLDNSPSPALKQASKALRVQILVRQGRLPRARSEAEALVQAIPEFTPILHLVALHERIGTPAPPDPEPVPVAAAGRLLIVIARVNPDVRLRLQRLLARPDLAPWTPLVVALDAGAAECADLPNAVDRPGLAVHRPATGTAVAAWTAAWTPPSEFLTCLTDGDGLIQAVDLRLDDPLPAPPIFPHAR